MAGSLFTADATGGRVWHGYGIVPGTSRFGSWYTAAAPASSPNSTWTARSTGVPGSATPGADEEDADQDFDFGVLVPWLLMVASVGIVLFLFLR